MKKKPLIATNGIEAIAPVFKRSPDPIAQRIILEGRLKDIRAVLASWDGDLKALPSRDIWHRLSDDTISLAGFLKPTGKKQRCLKEAIGVIESVGKTHSYHGELERFSKKIHQFSKNRLQQLFEAALIESESEKQGENANFILLMRKYRDHLAKGGEWNSDFQRQFAQYKEFFPNGGRSIQVQAQSLLINYSTLRAMVPALRFLQEAGVDVPSPYQKHLEALKITRKRRASEREKKRKQRLKVARK